MVKKILSLIFLLFFTISCAGDTIGSVKRGLTGQKQTSTDEVLVEKCFFQGKEYKIKGSCDGETWTFFSSKPLNINQKIFIDYKKEDLIYFDSLCRNFFE